MKSIEEIKEYIASVHWTFAKTYAETAPHEYTVRDWNPDKEELFVKFVEFIRKNGSVKTFWGNEYVYYNIDEWYYWTMGDPLEETILINRAKRKIKQDEGE